MSKPKPRVTISFTIDLTDEWAEYYDMVGASPERLGQRIADDIVDTSFNGDELIVPCVQVWDSRAVEISQ